MVSLITSRAYLSTSEKVVELYRGYPKRLKPSTRELKDSLLAGVDWILRNQFPSGKFLYYYDASTNSTKKLQHPKNPGYYNMLRHSGGTITLLRAYELTGGAFCASEKRPGSFLVYLLRDGRVDERDGRLCRFVMDNGKAKLGGTGIGLVALMHYYRLTGDTYFLEHCGEMANHLLSQIDPEGEFIGYYIHPLFNNGLPLLNLSDEEKRKLFSFYYPVRRCWAWHFPEVRPYCGRQEDRDPGGGTDGSRFPRTHPADALSDLFLSLPADGWLMQAIEEWWSVPRCNIRAIWSSFWVMPKR